MATIQITVPDNNIYRNGKIISFTDGSADEILMREPLAIKGTTNDQFHTLREGDTLDGLAYKYYNQIAADSSKYWWVIADANNILDPTDISGLIGTALLIPDLNRVLIAQ